MKTLSENSPDQKVKQPEEPREKRPVAPEQSKRYRSVGWIAVCLFAALAVLAVFGIVSRSTATRNLQARSDEAATMVVTVIKPEETAASVPLQLPGETRAFSQAPIYAQTNGYLHRWYFDIGAKVNAGDKLAEIDTPEVDQQLAQARATLVQSKAQLDLSQSTYNRNQDLFNRKVISAQDFDNQTGDYRVKQATVKADEANVARLVALENFKVVTTPFNGIVTQRNTDIGALIVSGSGNPLFTVAQTTPLRVYVSVPEPFAHAVPNGTTADITFNESPNRHFPAKVVRTAGAIDVATRTLLTELELPNENGELLPGAYLQAHLKTQPTDRAILVPANVLLFRAEGPAVGVVGKDDKTELKLIKIGRDLGQRLEVIDGLKPDDRVIINPSDSLIAGTKVKIKADQPKEQKKP